MKEKPLKKQKKSISKTKASETSDPYNSKKYLEQPKVEQTKEEPAENKKIDSTKALSEKAHVPQSAKVTKEMTIAEIMEKNPEAIQKLSMLGLGCVGCHFASFDTLENGANIHGMDVDELLEEING